MANTDVLADVDGALKKLAEKSINQHVGGNGHGLRRWLDPPGVRARKQQLRAAGLHPGHGNLDVGIAVPIGCMVPFAIAAAMLVGAGLLVGKEFSNASRILPDHVVVRVIDDGAAGGPKVISTQTVPLR
jgi:hypothetical protein